MSIRATRVKQTDTVKYYFKKSPLIRLIILLALIGLILGGIFIFKYNTRPIPYIDAITPPVGSPGDVVVISGRNFGKNRDMSYVEFAGSKLTASSYLMWTDNTIKLVVPSNVQNGLVIVGTGKLQSSPAFFANITDIPTEVQEVNLVTGPVIASIEVDPKSASSWSKASVGDVIVITGNNFGDTRGQSKVYFTSNFDSSESVEVIPALEDDFCYEFWSDTEIRVRIPDGAAAGYVYVDTPSGKTEKKETFFSNGVGTKTFTDKKFFLVSYNVDIADIVTKDSSTITLRCPLPVISASQRELEITEVSPDPVLMSYQKTMIHQLNVERNISEKTYFKQSFVLPVYGIKTEVNEIKVSAKNQALSDVLYAFATRADELIPSENEKIISLASSIVKAEKNPYRKARLVYNYMISNFKIENDFRKGDANPLDLIERKSGDSYDFAIVYTALLRALDIPAFANCGVLVSPDLSTKNHMWSEFYISGMGWIPVDPALGAGMEYKKWDEGIDAKAFYFGNLDSHHIKFSRGINTQKPFYQDNKIVQRPRSFAFQMFWEEASANVEKYSSFWSDPVVKGIY